MLKCLPALHLSLYETPGSSSRRSLTTSRIVKERDTGFSARPLQISCVCADHPEFRLVVGLGGLEPPASPLSGVRSNHLSYRPNVASSVGGASRDRTDDPLLAKQVLSQLSYGPKCTRHRWDAPTATCLAARAGNSGCRSLVRTPGQAIKLSFCL